MDCKMNTVRNYRHAFVSVLERELSSSRTGTMTKWLLVVCSLAILLVLSVSLLSGCLPSSDEKQKPLTAEEVLALSDELEFAAIQAIHSQLDDNDDGKVDLSESEEFVQTELCGDSSSGERQKVCSSSEKSQRFHRTDKQITSMELWMTWHTNEVFNWTTDDVIFWLENHVHLPQYSEAFRRHKITGRLLPKVATNSGQILQSVLLIADSQHRQKIQLRAMDAILFGPPRMTGYWKDVIMTLSILLCVWGVLYALRQRWIAQSRIDSFLEDFRTKEEELTKLRSKLELQEMALDEDTDSGKEECKETPPNGPASLTPRDSSPTNEDALSEASFSRSSSLQDPESSLFRAHEEIEVLHKKVLSLESQLENTRTNIGLLQELLQESCKREWEHLDLRKRMAEEQMTKAQKVCDKIKKRRSSLFGSLHLANSSALEEAGLQITKAVNKMQSISECFDEYHKRWRKVEHICGFQVCSSPSSPTHHSGSSSQKTYDHAYLSTASDSSGNSISSLTMLGEGIGLRQTGASSGGYGGDVPHNMAMHRSSTLPRFRSKSLSLSEIEPFYYTSKSRSSSVSSSSSGSSALLRTFKAASPSSRQQSAESGDVDITDCYQLVGSQQRQSSSLVQHHQLHHSSLGSASLKRQEAADIAELSESPRHSRQSLKSSVSVPTLITRKDSYSEAVCGGEDGGSLSVDGEPGGEGGGVVFSISSDVSGTTNSSFFSSVALSAAKANTQQLSSESKQSLKPPSYRTASNGLEAIKEERASQLSLTSSSSSGSSRAGSSSPDKPKVKSSGSPLLRGTAAARTISTTTINHRAISSDV